MEAIFRKRRVSLKNPLLTLASLRARDFLRLFSESILIQHVTVFLLRSIYRI